MKSPICRVGSGVKRFGLSLVLCSVSAFIVSNAQVVYAKEDSFNLSGLIYEFDEKTDYSFDVNEDTDLADTKPFGNLVVSGDIHESELQNEFYAFKVKNGNAMLKYSFDKKQLDLDETEWCIIEDKDNDVNDIELKDKILRGTVILQTSLDGENWNVETEMTDVFTEDSKLSDEFYTTKDIQLQNGCYYRVIVAYEMRKKVEDKEILFVDVDNYDYKRIAEVYEFYADNKDESTILITAEDMPRKELGNRINTGKDNGFSEVNEIENDDPHYGWNLGKFIVNGYTREEKDDKGRPVFLKNVGDKVTLWFRLGQNIKSLNGDETLSVAEDTNGYDQHFETQKTNFKHGTLLIRYTDEQGVAHEPIIYTDYLAANAKTGADTKVQLFEEGDYEVSLDYEIKNSPREIGSVSILPSYHDYKIYFEFSIRNGNCMVYPFDVETGTELADKAITENGFKLDMAKSKYLTIDVTRKELKINGDGTGTEDVRFNRPAKDGDEYKDNGIYIFEVKNRYTGEETTKTIYVGSEKYLKALSKNKDMSVESLNKLISEGYEIAEDGSVFEGFDKITEGFLKK